MSAPIPEGSVVVTPTEMYREIRDMHDEVRRLASVVDPAIRELRDDVTEMKTQGEKAFKDHEDRIRSLERRMWQAVGAAVVLGPAAGFAANYLVK